MLILQAADRAASLGLSPEDRGDASFGCNQSFPASRLTSLQLARRMDSPSLHQQGGGGEDSLI